MDCVGRWVAVLAYLASPGLHSESLPAIVPFVAVLFWPDTVALAPLNLASFSAAAAFAALPVAAAALAALPSASRTLVAPLRRLAGLRRAAFQCCCFAGFHRAAAVGCCDSRRAACRCCDSRRAASEVDRSSNPLTLPWRKSGQPRAWRGQHRCLLGHTARATALITTTFT